jgi:excisionase family DNA binding protein
MPNPTDAILAAAVPEVPGLTRREVITAVQAHRARQAGIATPGAVVEPAAPGKLLRMREAAERAGLCPRTLWNLAARGQLRLVKLGRSTRVPESELIRLAGQKQTEGK